MTTTKLEPCPFCGSDEISPSSFDVRCLVCGAEMQGSPERAIAAWNRRALPLPADLEEWEKLAKNVTPGPWGWFGSTRTYMYLATQKWGRKFVMGFRRKGMHGAEPTFQVKSVMVPASELAIYEVDRTAITGKEPSVYRHEICGFRSPDATWIAACSPERILSLVRELAEARKAREWRTMDSAPKDGTEFQAWIDKYGWEPRCRFDPETEAFEIWGRVDYDQDGWDVYPHMRPVGWMPLPSAPSSEAETSKETPDVR